MAVQVLATKRPLSARFIAVFMLAVMAGFIYLQYRMNPVQFQFRYNGYALISIASFAADAVVLFLVSRIRGTVEGLGWYALFVASASVYAVSEIMQRLSATPEGGIFWTAISSIGITIVPFSIYFFVSEYVGRRERHTLLLGLFIICAGLINFLSANGSVLYIADPAKIQEFPWGYNNQTGPGYGLYISWIAILSGISLYRLYRFRKLATQQLIRRQASIFILAIGLPITVGVINDGLLPVFGHLTMPLAVLAQTFASVLILYGLKKYRLFTISPELLSSNILASMDEMVVVTRPDFSIERMNAKAEELLGSSAKQLTGTQLDHYFEASAWKTILARISKQQQRQTSVNELVLIGAHGERTPVRVNGTILHETEELDVYIFVVDDITELAASYNQVTAQNQTLTENRSELRRLLAESRDLQAQLAREKASVEHTVKVRTRELVIAQEQLKAADRLKSEFIVLSSHNLRTPLTVVLGALDLVRSTKLDANQKHFVDMIVSSAGQLRQFVEDMLTITQLEAGEQLQLEPSPVMAVLGPVLEQTALQAAAKQLALTTDLKFDDVQIDCSLIRLRGAIRSILDNAVKFTDAGTINLSGRAVAGKVTLIIRDTGVGITPDELPHLFSKFHRATDSMRYDYEGKGIGLYLSKLIIDDHRGSINIASKFGKSTTVTITLPVAKAATPNLK